MKLFSNPGRVAGFCYLLLVFIGPLRLIYIPTKLFVYGNAPATVNNIAANEYLFRAGIFADLIGALILVFLTLAFFRLFAGVDRYLAAMVVIFGGIMPALLYFVGVVCDFGVLTFIQPAAYLNVFSQPQHEAFAMLFIHLRNSLNTAAELLWGVWLIPLAILVYRSRFLPRFLGIWLALGGLAYISLSFVGMLYPQYEDLVYKFSQPAFFSEIAITLWLLIKGANPITNPHAIE
jgi:hypothetical protein